MHDAPILITGGTGTLGGHVAPRLLAAGAELRLLSRSHREAEEGIEYVVGDLAVDRGIDAAVAGVRTVVHLAGGAKGDEVLAGHLVRAARDAGVEHIVFISVTAADRIPLTYLRAKHEAEQVLADSGVPHTVLRAAQFHDLVLKTARAMTKLPVVPRPGGLRLQPVDSDEVAARLVELTLDRPAGRVADLVGPEVHPMGDLVRAYLSAAGKHRAMLPLRIPGKAGRAYRAGDNLVLDGAMVGKRTWAEFLADTVSRAPGTASRCTSPGASNRALSEFHGVRVGGATDTAPPSTAVRLAASQSSTSSATRKWPATRDPTSTSSIMSACAEFAISSVARPASRIATSAPPSPL